MKALVYKAHHTMVYPKYADPIATDRKSVIRIHASGICGSNMHAWHGHDSRRVHPMVLGHEITGQAFSGAFSGQRVTLNPFIRFSHCEIPHKRTHQPTPLTHSMKRLLSVISIAFLMRSVARSHASIHSIAYMTVVLWSTLVYKPQVVISMRADWR